MDAFSPADLEKVRIDDLYFFMDYLNLYENRENKMQENAERGKARKIACLRSFFKHYYKKQMITQNLLIWQRVGKNFMIPLQNLSVHAIKRVSSSNHLIQLSHGGVFRKATLCNIPFTCLMILQH